jgi:hypothetical protein
MNKHEDRVKRCTTLMKEYGFDVLILTKLFKG